MLRASTPKALPMASKRQTLAIQVPQPTPTLGAPPLMKAPHLDKENNTHQD